MRYQIKGIVEYLKMVKKINFHLISRISLRSKKLSILQRNRETSIFPSEKANRNHFRFKLEL